MTQHEIAKVQELQERRVDLLSRIECLRATNKPFKLESVSLLLVMKELYTLTQNEDYKI
jgi:hypothetical protein